MSQNQIPSVTQVTRLNLGAMTGWQQQLEKSRQETKPFPVGVYVCKIVEARFNQYEDGKIQVVWDVDIAEGSYTDYFYKKSQRLDDWDFHAQFKRNLTKDGQHVEKSFTDFVAVLEQENPKFHFGENTQPQDFKGLLCGFTFDEEEYNGKTSVRIKFPCSIARARKVQETQSKIDQHLNSPEKKNIFSASDIAKVEAEDFPF